MSGRLYNNLVGLLPQFRVDPNRPGKCLGELLRKGISKDFPQQGETLTPPNIKIWQQSYEALRAIAVNADQRAFPRRYSSTSTGIATEQCSAIVSDYIKMYGSEKNSRESAVSATLKQWLNRKA